MRLPCPGTINHKALAFDSLSLKPMEKEKRKLEARSPGFQVAVGLYRLRGQG